MNSPAILELGFPGAWGPRSPSICPGLVARFCLWGSGEMSRELPDHKVESRDKSGQIEGDRGPRGPRNPSSKIAGEFIGEIPKPLIVNKHLS